METPLPELVKTLQAVKKERSDLSKKDKELEAQKLELEEQIIQSLDAKGIDLARTDTGRVLINESVVAQPEDWDSIFKFIRENNYFHLLIKRLNNAAYRELLENFGELPGAVTFTQRKLSLSAK